MTLQSKVQELEDYSVDSLKGIDIDFKELYICESIFLKNF